jgi:hypothetical protein
MAGDPSIAIRFPRLRLPEFRVELRSMRNTIPSQEYNSESKTAHQDHNRSGDSIGFNSDRLQGVDC